MGVKETNVSNGIMKLVSRLGGRIFRNQVGKYEIEPGRWISSGLCVGSSDLIGWKPVTITQEMVGRQLAVFLAIEVKKPKGRKATEDQENFIRVVREAGGIAGVARSDEEALALLRPEG